MRQHAARSGPARLLLRIAGLSAVVIAAGIPGYSWPHLGSREGFPWLASGLAAALLFVWGMELWPAVLIGALAVSLQHGLAPLPAAGMALGCASGAVATVALLRAARLNPRFGDPRDVVLFVWAAAAGAVLPPSIGLLGYWAGGQLGEFALPIAWVRWYANSAVGALLVVPIVVSMQMRDWAALTGRRGELVLWGLGVGVAMLAALRVDPPHDWPAVILLSMLPVIWSAMRFSLGVTSAAVLALSGTAAWNLCFRHSNIPDYDVMIDMRMLWSFVGILTVLGLMIAALRAGAERSARYYERLFYSNPQPLWTYDLDTLRFLTVNDSMVRRYGYTRDELLSMTMEDLCRPEDRAAMYETIAAYRRGAGADGVPIERSHRTKSGRMIDVEIFGQDISAGRRMRLVFAHDVTERRRLERALLAARDEEQRRLGQEMHDGLGQNLTALSIYTGAMLNQLRRSEPTAVDDLERLSELARKALEDCRTIAHGLSPLGDFHGNLVAALRELALHSTVPGRVRVELNVDGDAAAPAVAGPVRDHLFRIVQESVNNALKHSAAALIEIGLVVRPDAVRVSIADNGRGLPEDALVSPGLGLQTIRYRAASIGARLSIGPRDGGGTLVVCECPATALDAQRDRQSKIA